jgi:hypothetical protein
MKFLVASLLLVPCLLSFIACGSTHVMGALPPRQLQSITVTPASATAQNTFRQVQFSAMGTFNMAPMSAVPQVTWSIAGDPMSMMPAPAGVTINQNGLASCSTFSGVVMIQASGPMDQSMSGMQMGMMTSNVAGTAQLTCP